VSTAEAAALAAALCRRFEGLRLRPYLCPAGVPTIGYGSTIYERGVPVRLTDAPISRDRAEALLLHDLRTRRLPAVLALCPGADTPGRVAALADFAFNAGVGALRASTMRRRVNAGQWDQVPAELRRWVRGGGKVLPGLVARREAEAALIGLR
jgi:lysozyme